LTLLWCSDVRAACRFLSGTVRHLQRRFARGTWNQVCQGHHYVGIHIQRGCGRQCRLSCNHRECHQYDLLRCIFHFLFWEVTRTFFTFFPKKNPYAASQEVKKVIEINPYLLGTMAGGAADCQHWLQELGVKCRLFELKNKERMSVAAASQTLCNMLQDYKGFGLSVASACSDFLPKHQCMCDCHKFGFKNFSVFFLWLT
jgi:hypothetical protein